MVHSYSKYSQRKQKNLKALIVTMETIYLVQEIFRKKTTHAVENLNKLGDMLDDQAVPMKARYRALFTLKNLGGKDAVANISKGFKDPSALLKHECAYCLGQMQGN